MAGTLVHLGKLDEIAGRYAEATGRYRTALALQRRDLGDSARETRLTLQSLANVLHSSGRVAEAAPLFDAWERQLTAATGPRDTLHAYQLDLLGTYVARKVLVDSTARGRAERLFRESLRLRRQLLGPRHADVAVTAQHLAGVLRGPRGQQEADSLYREALLILRTVYPQGHADVGILLLAYGNFLSSKGAHARAVAILDSAVTMSRVVYGPTHALTGAALIQYGAALIRAREFAAAETALREAVGIHERESGAWNLMTVRARATLADAVAARGRPRDAEQTLLALFTHERDARGLGHPQTQRLVQQLVRHFERYGPASEVPRYAALRTAPAR